VIGKRKTSEEQETDEALVAAAQRALPAFEHLYRRYVNDIYRFCYRRIGSEADAADATSQVFTRALASIQKCRPETFRAWLYAIARNVVIDHHRAAKPAAQIEESFELADDTDGPEELAIQQDQRRRLAGLLTFLSDDQRAVIELRLAGLSAAEIATALGKTRNAIDQAQFRAVSRLRDLLSPAGMPVQETRR
jgi:RNA polymerase sigma-70 factor (ECF subfamily)